MSALVSSVQREVVTPRGAWLAAGFEAAMQRYAVHVLAMTYLRVPLPVLAEVSHPRCCSHAPDRAARGWVRQEPVVDVHAANQLFFQAVASQKRCLLATVEEERRAKRGKK